MAEAIKPPETVVRGVSLQTQTADVGDDVPAITSKPAPEQVSSEDRLEPGREGVQLGVVHFPGQGPGVLLGFHPDSGDDFRLELGFRRNLDLTQDPDTVSVQISGMLGMYAPMIERDLGPAKLNVDGGVAFVTSSRNYASVSENTAQPVHYLNNILGVSVMTSLRGAGNRATWEVGLRTIVGHEREGQNDQVDRRLGVAFIPSAQLYF